MVELDDDIEEMDECCWCIWLGEADDLFECSDGGVFRWN
jgi:hypothetical protein